MPIEEMKHLINKRAGSLPPAKRETASPASIENKKEEIHPDIEIEKRHIIENHSNKNRLIIVIKKIMSDVEKLLKDIELLNNNKNDTSNLKQNHKQFVEDTNANWAVLNEKIKKLEDDNIKLENINKNLLERIEELNDI